MMQKILDLKQVDVILMLSFRAFVEAVNAFDFLQTYAQPDVSKGRRASARLAFFLLNPNLIVAPVAAR